MGWERAILNQTPERVGSRLKALTPRGGFSGILWVPKQLRGCRLRGRRDAGQGMSQLRGL